MARHLTRPATRLAGTEDEASGFASMVTDLVGANLADSWARALVGRLVRGAVVLTSTDNQQSVTVEFRRDEIVVSDDRLPGAPTMAGSWIELAHVCAGTRSPLAAIRAGEVRVSNLSRPDLLAAAGYVMAAPREDQVARRRAVGVAAAVLVCLVLVVVVARRRG